MKESSEGENESIAHGGPIYVPNLVGPLTTVPDFQAALLSELQNLQSELSLDSSELRDDIDLSVDELKIFSEEELVDMALKEAFKDGENTGSSPEPLVEHSNARREDDLRMCSNKDSCSQSSRRRRDTSAPLELSNGSHSSTSCNIATINSNNSKNGKRRKSNKHDVNESYLMKVDDLVKIKQKQDQDKAMTRLHSFNCKINYSGITSLNRTNTMQSLRSTNFGKKLKSADLQEHIAVILPEVAICVEIYHCIRKWFKTQEFLVLGGQTLTEMRDKIYCLTDQMMQKAGQHDPSGYFLVEGDCKHTIIFRDMRLIHPDDLQNRVAYPIVSFQIKFRTQKCMVCKVYRAVKVTVDDKWAPDNPCYFCNDCYYLLHHSENGSLLYSGFSAYDYVHD